MARVFEVTFRVAGEKTFSFYDDTADGARNRAASRTWEDILDGDFDTIAEDLNKWCKIKIVDVADKGEMPPHLPLHSAPIIEALHRILKHYSLETSLTYDGSLDHPYRDMCAVALALGGHVKGPLPNELDIVRGYKTGEIAASEHSDMPLGKVIEQVRAFGPGSQT